MRNVLRPLSKKLFFVVDIFGIIVALAFSWWYKKSVDQTFISVWQDYLKFIFGIVPLYLLVFSAFDLYSSKRGQSFFNEGIKIIEGNAIGGLLLFGLFFILKFGYVSRAIIIAFVIVNTLIDLISRYTSRVILRYIRARGYNIKYMLIIGAGELGYRFWKRLDSHRETGFQVKGFLDDDEKKQGMKIGKASVIAKINMLEDYLNKVHIDEAVIALPVTAYEKLGAIIEICEKYGIKVSIIPDFYRYIPAKPKVTEFGDIPLIYIRDIPLDTFINRLVKRTFDILVSLVLILGSLPFMILIAVGVKLSSPGPILFKQQRVGLNRHFFNMYKFRSMSISTDEIACTTWTTASDPRKTTFGEFIRATSLDELPQFFNVLKGDMSLVGPRPERPHFVEKFKDQIANYMVKHQVKPGITGWAQVNGWRGDTSIEERIKCDLYYIENWSLILDLKIIFMTVFKGFVNRNAY